MATLRIKFADTHEPTVIPLDREPLSIGRHADNAIQIIDRSLSGYHAELVFKDGRYQLRDLASTNGTYVNGETIKECELLEQCEIWFGKFACEFDPEQS